MQDIEKKQLSIKVAKIIKRLPPIPNNIDRILNVAQTSKNGSDKILCMLHHDPGLCADILHIANQSSDTLENIETTDDALRDIGIEPVIQLVRFCYARNSIRTHLDTLKNLKQYFKHSDKISKSSRILARFSGKNAHDCELYATAGLIHDIGRLVLFMACDRNNASLIGTTAEQMASIDHDERRVLGLSHSEVGEQLCKRWNFSPLLREAVLRHHNPLYKKRFSAPGAYIFLAHFVAYDDMSGDILSKMLPVEILTNLNLTIKDIIEARKLLKSSPEN